MRAVDDVSLDLVAGEVVAVVGESGSGKSVLARMLARIIRPTSGDLILHGSPIPRKAKRSLDYASEVQLVLQDPFASMNPVHKMRHNLVRPLIIHGAKRENVEALAEAALTRVSLEPPESIPRPLPARALRRSAPARLDRASPVHRAASTARRRADLDAGRLGAPGRPQPPARAL